MDIASIYAIDSLTDSLSSSVLYDDEDDIYDNLTCDHEWRIDNANNNQMCIKCGFVEELQTFEEDTSYSESVAFENNQITIKGAGSKLRKFNLWHEGQSFSIKLFNKDLLRIKDICKKIGIPSMIGDDAQLIYKRFKQIIGFDKIISKSSTKNKKISLMEQYKNDDKTIKEIILSDCKLRGDGRIGLLCASIYYACMKNNICILPKVIIKGAGIKSKNMNDGCNALLQIHHLNDPELLKLMPVVCFPYPENYYQTVVDAFNDIFVKYNIVTTDGERFFQLTDNMKKDFYDSLVRIKKYNLIFNHKTHSLAICMMLIYLTEIVHINMKGFKKIICDEFDLSNPTINNSYQDLLLNKNFLLGFKNVDVIKPNINKEQFLNFFKNISDNNNYVTPSIQNSIINSVDIFK